MRTSALSQAVPEAAHDIDRIPKSVPSGPCGLLRLIDDGGGGVGALVLHPPQWELSKELLKEEEWS